MMKIGNQLFIPWAQAAQVIPEGSLKAAKHRGNIKVLKSGSQLLIDVSSLSETHRERIKKAFGEPEQSARAQLVLSLITHDPEAEQFFLAYRYDENKALPLEYVAKYTQAACWLNMLKRVDKKMIRSLGMKPAEFWAVVIDLIKKKGIDLPTSTRRLKDRIEAYRQKGYESIVDWRFGNKLAAKVKDELAESFLLELLSHPNQYDDVLVAHIYNNEAKKRGYKPITYATVGNWRRRHEALIIARRQGWASFDDKYRVQVLGRRPSAPLLLVEHDDNVLDLYFQDENGAYNRYKAIVVIDSFNDYVLGYAYSLQLSNELVYAAYANAMRHIKELTGDWYLPHQIKSDNWNRKELFPFYESIGHFFPSPVGSKKRGYIEQFFGSAHWKRCLKAGANNYTGNNITARTRGVNMEVLASNKQAYPTVAAGVQQIEDFFARLRQLPDSSGKSKQQKWLEAWQNMPDARKRRITDEQYLMVFGIEKKEKIRISNLGIRTQIAGEEYYYEVPKELHLQAIGAEVTIKYDPINLSRVLVIGNQFRFVAGQARRIAKAICDYLPGERAYLNALLQEKRKQVDYVNDLAARRQRILAESGIEPDALLSSGLLVKSIKQDAETRYLNQLTGLGENADQDMLDPLDQM